MDFEISTGHHERIVVLFERCMIACALYEDFWMKVMIGWVLCVPGCKCKSPSTPLFCFVFERFFCFTLILIEEKLS